MGGDAYAGAMRRVDGRLVFSPTDVTKHLACPHITSLDLAATEPGGPRPAAPDDALALVFARGLAHERRYLDAVLASGRQVVAIESGPRAGADTLSALRAGADVVYQAALGSLPTRWLGYADFLLRVEEPSALGPWRYDVADTKLARRLKVPALIQLATYAEALEAIQGVPARRLVVVGGDGVEHPWRLVDVGAYARRARERLVEAADATSANLGLGGLPTEPVPVPHCLQCRWSEHCSREWEAADDLSLVAGMRRATREVLRAEGIATVAALAAAPDGAPSALPRRTWVRVRDQARLQVQERTSGRPSYELLEPEPGHGLLSLPPPSPADVYLDFEGDPFAEDGRGLEYLAGLLTRGGEFTAWWAHDPPAERRLVADLLAELHRRWQQAPDLHVYHYAAYEVTRLKELTGRYGVAEDLLDGLLRGEVFVDLYQVVKQAIRVSKPSYSIKKLEDFYWGQVRGSTDDGEVTDALDSVVQYERWLTETDEGRRAAILASIRAYNEVDVRSTEALHNWVEERRAELEQAYGPLPRPAHAVPSEAFAISERAATQARLAEELRAAGQPLWAGLVGWHRREDRPGWWDYFRADDMGVADLVLDPVMVGGLGEPVEIGREKLSTLWRYPFEPQDCRLEVGRIAHAAEPGHPGAGTVLALDPGFDSGEGYVVLKRRSRDAPLRPLGLHPPGPLDATVLQDAVSRAARGVLERRSSVAQRLVGRVPPRQIAPRPGELPAETALRVGRGLADEVLAVQGPPGSGKTRLAAELIRALLDDGRRVGVTALSHAVIGNLLAAVGRPALRKGPTPQDGTGREGPDGCVTVVEDNAAIVAALADGSARLVGGTAWLWSREDLAGSVDVLVVDEAGQFSLANAVAVSSAVAEGGPAVGGPTGLVLLGDPQQLTQPTRAIHPDGSGRSALEHLIGAVDTIAADRGVFLDRTWRLHPQIADLVSTVSYDDRLEAAPGRERQRIDGPGQLTGSGLRWMPVRHTGCSTESAEEAVVARDLVTELLRCEWTDAEGVRRPMTPADVLVVAPFNAHVGLLQRAVPPGVRVGTVDRFQGQEAPVVIYSLAASSAADAPRGVGFLYDLHRLNVAISRARALSVVIGHPDLLEAPVATPEQLRMVNALCLYADRATVVTR